MFGYVRPFKPQMRFCEYDAYKSVYCGLCKVLGQEYGMMARMTLSYDGTFLAMMGAALSEGKASVCAGRCTCNPLKKCSFYRGEGDSLSYAASVNVLLSAARCRDGIRDNRGPKKWIAGVMLFFLRGAERKAALREPETAKIICAQMDAQHQLENARCAIPDAAAEPTANMLAHFAAHFARNDGERRILSVLGYQLGRWVYLADALDDLTADLKDGAYNPLAEKFRLTGTSTAEKIQEAVSYARQVLCANEARLSGAYELLNLHRLQPVLNNVIYEGLPAVRKQLPRTGKKGKQEEPHERSV